MATVEKIRRDIEKTKEKISEQQKRLRALEAQLTEEENLEIVRMVKPRPLLSPPSPAAGMANPPTRKRPGQRPLPRGMPSPRRSL